MPAVDTREPSVVSLDASTPETVEHTRHELGRSHRQHGSGIHAIRDTSPSDHGNSPHSHAFSAAVPDKPKVLSTTECSYLLLNETEPKLATYHMGEWCDDVNTVPPFQIYCIDQGTVRVCVCNWAFTQPCSSKGIGDAWKSIDDKCPDKMGMATGSWFEIAWNKGYWRNTCESGYMCGSYRGVFCS